VKPIEFTYFGQRITIRPTPIAAPAILLYFARLERVKIALPAQIPLTRAQADAEGREGPTHEDVIHFNTHRRINLMDPYRSHLYNRKCSKAGDYYWSWMVSPPDPARGLYPNFIQTYIPGALTGHWQGASAVSLLLYVLGHDDSLLYRDPEHRRVPGLAVED